MIPVTLAILDQLAVPKTFDDLVMQIQARDCNMFHPMMGVPRAYMEVPDDNGTIHRWVYKVLSWHMMGPRSKCEAPLVAHYWKMFVELRREFARLYGDVEPVIVWRRTPEFEEIPEHKSFDPNKVHPLACRMYLRFAIPGLDLQRGHPEFWNERMDRDDPQWQLRPEAIA